MKRKQTLISLAIILSIFPMYLSAQEEKKDPEYRKETEKDLQFRTGFEIEKKLSKHFSVALSEELRLKDNISEVDRIYSDLCIAYKATNWMKFSASYTFISIDKEGRKKDNYKKYWDLRHRLTMGVALNYKTLSNWNFSLKERVQTTFLTEKDLDRREKSNPIWCLKSKFSAEYKFRRIPIKPFVSLELCNTLNAPKLAGGDYLEKVRSSIGTEYRFDKHSSINLYYRFDYNINKKIDVKKSSGALKSFIERTDYNHILSVSYKYKF